jgi:hypothetical protein
LPKLVRETFRSVLWEKLSDTLIRVAESLPTAKRGLLSWLQEVRDTERLSYNAIPQHLKLDLHCIWISEILTVENFEREIPTIVRLTQIYRSKRFLSMPILPNEITERLRDIKSHTFGTSWKNLGLLDFENHKLSQFVNHATLECHSFSGGHIMLTVRLFPSEGLQNNLNSVIQSESKQKTSLHRPTFKNFFRGWWGSRYTSGDLQKQRAIQKIINECKRKAAETLFEWKTGLIFKKRYLLPSIELWIKDAPISNPEAQEAPRTPPLKTFWDSIGLSSDPLHYYHAEKNCYKLYLPDRGFPDFSVKLLVEKSKFDSKPDRNSSTEEQISFHVNHWVPTLLSIWSVRAILLDIVDSLAALRMVVFRPRLLRHAGNLFDWITQLGNNEILLQRLMADCSQTQLAPFYEHSCVPEFQINKFKTTAELKSDLFYTQNYLVKKADALVAIIKGHLKPSLEIKTIRSNHITQLIALMLTILALMTSLMSVATNKRLCSLKALKPLCKTMDSYFVAEEVESDGPQEHLDLKQKQVALPFNIESVFTSTQEVSCKFSN